MPVEEQVRAAVTRYGIRSDWMGTKAAKKTVYSLFADGRKIGGPFSHEQVRQEQTDLTVRDIMAVFGGQE
jgi:hypothetical protein